jgi:hypothetical protein
LATLALAQQLGDGRERPHRHGGVEGLVEGGDPALPADPLGGRDAGREGEVVAVQVDPGGDLARPGQVDLDGQPVPGEGGHDRRVAEQRLLLGADHPADGGQRRRVAGGEPVPDRGHDRRPDPDGQHGGQQEAEGAPHGRINTKLRYGDGTPGACLHPSDPLVASWSSLPAFLFFIWPEYRVRRRGRSTEQWPTLG